MKKTFKVTHQRGIHARPATNLVLLAAKFESTIKLTTDSSEADMKSIMGLMSLGMYNGQVFTLEVTGKDESEAMKEICKHLCETDLATEIDA